MLPLPPDEQFRMMELWYAALNSPRFGIRIETDDYIKLRSQLYTARRDSNDESLQDFSITASPAKANELWIVRKRVTITIPDEELDANKS